MQIADIKRARQSLSARLSRWIVFFAAAIFVAALGYMAVVARKAVRKEAVLGANRVLDNTVLRVNGILEDVELVADNLEGRIYQNLDNPDTMFDLSREVVATNAFLNGCSISFEPDYFKEKGRYFSAYSNRIFTWTGICCPSSWGSPAGRNPIRTRRSLTTKSWTPR